MRPGERVDRGVLVRTDGRTGVDRDEANAIPPVKLEEGVPDRRLHHLHARAVVRIPVGEVGHLLRVGAGGCVLAVGAVRPSAIGGLGRHDVDALEPAIAGARVIGRPRLLAARTSAGRPGHCVVAVGVRRVLAEAHRRRVNVVSGGSGRQRAGRQRDIAAMFARQEVVVERTAVADHRVAERTVRGSIWIAVRRRAVVGERVAGVDAVAPTIILVGRIVTRALAIDDLRIAADQVDGRRSNEGIDLDAGPRRAIARHQVAGAINGREVRDLRVVVDRIELVRIPRRVTLQAVRRRRRAAAVAAAGLVDVAVVDRFRHEARSHAARVVEYEHHVRLDLRRQ